LIALQIFMLILFARCTQMAGLSSIGTVTEAYTYFTGVEIMMFVGFGYLMTFLKSYGLSAVCFTMLVTAIGLQWYLFVDSFFYQIYNNYANGHDYAWTYINIDIYSLLNCLFGVSAVLISFGAVIGKVSPLQLVVMTILELMFHAFNLNVILLGGIKLADVGGTYVDHMFGAYFGLTVAYVLTASSRNQAGEGKMHVSPPAGYVADIFSLIGTVFLWIYWPSFVGGGAQANSIEQQRCIINTLLSLSASTMISFVLSSFWAERGKFRPVDIQNATLAGGVAIGTVANYDSNPIAAVFIGITAGAVSTYGYHFIQPFLLAKFGLHDTCGIHNLHAMPSVIGAVASVIMAAYAQSGNRDYNADIFANGQWWRQLAGIGLCFTCAVITGWFTGMILRCFDPSEEDDFQPFEDDFYWEKASDYIAVTMQRVIANTNSSKHNLDASYHSQMSAHGGLTPREDVTREIAMQALSGDNDDDVNTKV